MNETYLVFSCTAYEKAELTRVEANAVTMFKP